jgi:hypothetical protein
MSLVEDHSAGDTRSNRCWLKSSGQRVTHREEVEDEERKPRRGDRHCPSPPSPHTPSLSVCHWCVPGSLEHVEQSPRTLQPLMGGSSVSTSSKRPGSGSSASSFPLGGFPPSSRWSSRPRRTSLTSHSTLSSLSTAAMVRLIFFTKKGFCRGGSHQEATLCSGFGVSSRRQGQPAPKMPDLMAAFRDG